MTGQEEPLEETDETLIYWDMIGLGDFMFDAEKQGYDFHYDNWDSLDVFQKYIVDTKVSHTNRDELEMSRFVACYIFLGYAINEKYGSKWIMINDGTVDSGMYGIDNLVKSNPEMYLVPRDSVIMAILGRMEEGLKEHVEKFVNFDASDFDWIDKLEEG